MHTTTSPNLLQEQDLFIEDLKSKGRSLNTLKNYKTDIDCFKYYWKRIKKDLDLSGFDIQQVKEYGAFLDEKYSSSNSKRRRVQALRIFFDFLVQNGKFPGNPVRGLASSPKFVDIPRPTSFIDIKTLWIYLVQEANASSSLTTLLSQRNLTLFLLIYGGGLKVSDLSQLKSSDLSLGTSPRILIRPLKRDPYTIPLPAIFDEIYNRYLKELIKFKKESKIDFDDLLFNANPYRILAGGLSARGLEIIFEDLRKKLLVDVTPKTLRQACIFKWLQEGNKEGLVKEWMGVAPSYSLKPYRDGLLENSYSSDFLEELYYFHTKKILQ
jgi:site-specific recombinase XerD